MRPTRRPSATRAPTRSAISGERPQQALPTAPAFAGPLAHPPPGAPRTSGRRRLQRIPFPEVLFGAAEEISRGKDTPSGHWEIAGVPVLFDWGYFPRAEPTSRPASPPRSSGRRACRHPRRPARLWHRDHRDRGRGEHPDGKADPLHLGRQRAADRRPRDGLRPRPALWLCEIGAAPRRCPQYRTGDRPPLRRRECRHVPAHGQPPRLRRAAARADRPRPRPRRRPPGDRGRQ